MSSKVPAPELIVVARDLELRYGSHVALARSTFEIPKVGVVSVIGPNGSGKSTLLCSPGRAGPDRSREPAGAGNGTR